MNPLNRVNILKIPNLSRINQCWNSSQVKYNKICDWKTEASLAKSLLANIVYVDKCFVALSKPWALPVTRMKSPDEGKISKRKQEYLDMIDPGRKFNNSPIVMQDTFDYLSSYFQVPNLYLARTCPRLWSGITLLSSSEEGVEQVSKAIRRAKGSSIPHLRLHCIVRGIMKPEQGEERCAIELVELDELADYKEPVYIPPSKIVGDRKYKIRHPGKDKNFKVANVRWRTLATNPKLSVSLVELETSLSQWSFVQCFLAYKATFVLGDQYFSSRVNHIAGVPFLKNPQKKAKTVDDILATSQVNIRLPTELKNALQIRYHSQLPLMIHLAGMKLPLLKRSIKSLKCPKIMPPSSLVLQSQNHDNDSADIELDASGQQFLPEHFVSTLNALELNVFQ